MVHVQCTCTCIYIHASVHKEYSLHFVWASLGLWQTHGFLVYKLASSVYYTYAVCRGMCVNACTCIYIYSSTVIQEESNPTQLGGDSSERTATSAMGLSKPANYPLVITKESPRVECDSGYVYSTPDKMPTDELEPPSSPPPGSLLRLAAVVPPLLLNNGANVNFIPEKPQQSDVEDTAGNDPIATSSGSDILTQLPLFPHPVEVSLLRPLPLFPHPVEVLLLKHSSLGWMQLSVLLKV